MPTQTIQRPIWKPNPGPQEEALKHQEFEILYGGARGGGKTDAGLVWLLDLKDEPNARALVLRRNAEDLADWVDRANRMFISQGAVKTGAPGSFKFPSGYTIRTGHLKDDDAYTKYQGHEYQRLLIEELTQIPTEKRYKDLLSSCRSTIEGIRPKVFLTTNPGGIGHSWVKKRFKIGDNPHGVAFRDPETGLSRVFIPAKVEDNPVLMQKDPNYVRVLEGYKTSDPEKYKAWRNGDWNVFIGQFFDTWNELLSVVPRDYEIGFGTAISGYDYGYGAPACFGRGLVDQDGRVWITHEYYETQKEADQQGQEIIQLLGGEDSGMTFADPSIFSTRTVSTNPDKLTTAKFVSDALRNAGLRVTQANNNRISGWATVRKYLKMGPACSYHRAMQMVECPMLHVKENCHNLIRTFPDQVYDEHNKEDLDTDGEDHALDMLRYLLVHSPIKMREKQQVRTFSGGDPVTGYGSSFKKKTRTFSKRGY